MSFIIGAATDIGSTKQTNQDSLTIRRGKCGDKEIAFAILCDGMGGLQKGEVASAMTVRKFSEWSEQRLPMIISQNNVFDIIREDWDELVHNLNTELYTYGNSNHINLGTTVTGIIIIDDKYLVINVGDSRTYLLDNTITQITEDQSLIAREIKMGRITPEQAATDPRRNVLLQCIGATADIEIEYYNGDAINGQGFLICSDGLRHMVTSEELFEKMNPVIMNSREIITNSLTGLIKLNMQRNETDNITAAFIKIA